MGKRRKKSKGKKKRRTATTAVDLALRAFLEVKRGVLLAARGFQPAETPTGESSEWWTRLWTRLEESRLFYIPPEDFQAIMHAGVFEVNEAAQREGWSEELGTLKEMGDYVASAARGIEPPDPSRWPFRDVWVAAGPGLPLPYELAETRVHRAIRAQLDVSSGTLLGQLYTRDAQGRPLILEAINVKYASDGYGLKAALVWNHAYNAERGGWDNPADFSPWTTNGVMDYLSQFGTYTEESPSPQYRQSNYKTFRGSGIPMPVPKPYYVVKLRSKVSREPDRAPERPTGRTWVKTYATDVRGHERCRVARGPLPLSPEDAAKYRRRGYRVYLSRPLKAYDAQRLLKRGASPKRVDEWMALKVTWVKNHLSPADPDLPYVPGIRVA